MDNKRAAVFIEKQVDDFRDEVKRVEEDFKRFLFELKGGKIQLRDSGNRLREGLYNLEKITGVTRGFTEGYVRGVELCSE